MPPAPETIAEGLGGRKTSNGWMAKCPAHNDNNPSLSISEENGKTLVHCFAGCSQEEVIAALIELGLWSSSSPMHQIIKRKTILQIPLDIDVTQSRLTLDEVSIGQTYAQSRQQMLLYDHERGCWYCWNNFYWERDLTGTTLWEASSYVKMLFDTNTGNNKVRMNFVKAVLERASVEPGIGVTSDIWDQDEWLLGAPHTTYDLSNGELVSNEAKNHISKTTDVDARSDCPRWRAFIDEITEGDVALALYLQKVAGYCLTGSTREQALFFLHGPGGNGKTVFVETLASVMGDYAIAAPPEIFAIGGFDRHPTEIARMAGARLVYASETEEGRRWNAARIKQLTGGDRITARFMRQDFFEFTPHFKVLILGNHRPALTNVTEGERRRLHVIPLQFVPSKPDSELPEKLEAEASGILEWMIEGAVLWNSEGLSKPPIVAEATDEYFADQDLFRQWLDDECLCEPENESLYTSSKELYRSWQACMQAAGEDAGTRKSFGDRLRRANLKPTTKRIGNSATKVWLGIQLNNVGYDNYHDR